MRITDVRTVVVNATMRNWVFVQVQTDQPGLWGWGEATLELGEVESALAELG